MFPRYEENRGYLQNEFVNCPWDESTGMNPDELEKQINALWNARGTEAVSVAKARIQRYIVQNAQIEVNPHSLFPGKLRHGITYTKNGGSQMGMFERLFRRIRSETLSELLPETNESIKLMNATGLATCESDFWHILLNWNDILDLGLCGMKERTFQARKEKQQQGTLTQSQADFYESVLISLDSIDLYIGRLIDYAEQMQGMDDYVACMRHIRYSRPETFYHVLMLSLVYVYIFEMGCERARSLGRIDQLYLPYYRRDLEQGTYTKEEIRELLRYFFGRYSQAGRFAAQPFTLGGTLPNGTDAWNELSDLILEVYDGMDILDPKIHIRWHPDFPTERMRNLMRMIRAGHSAIVLLNDEIVYQGYEKLGIPRSESCHYMPVGCYEPVIAGIEDPMLGASWLSIPKAIELAVNNGYDVMTGKRLGPQTGEEFESFKAFYQAFLTQLDNMVEVVIDGVEKQNEIAREINPSPLFSCSMESCISSGKDVFENGLPRSNVSIKCCGIGTTADALVAMKQLVFDQKLVSYDDMRKALLANWAGYEWLREKALALPEKFGNHQPLTDGFAQTVYHHLADLYVGRPCNRGGVYRMGGDSITKCIHFGAKLSATPDGRKAGTPFSKNFSGTAGMETEGLTAAMLSALAIDQTEHVNGCVLDFVAHPSALEGEAGLDALTTLAEVYMKQGGFALQGNVLQVEQLKEAKIHPEKYPNLQVRVCGWNEYFVNMSEEAQDAFIKRLEAI